MSEAPEKVADEWDTPLGGITQQPRMFYKRTHMEVAAAEIRFVVPASEISEAAAEGIWEALGRDEFPIFQAHKQQMVSLQVSPEGAEQTVEVQNGWLIACADRSSAVTLLPSTVVVQTQAYARYSESIAPRIEAVLPLFAEATGATKVSRIGLRYVNRLRDTEATTPQFWSNYIDPSFAGALRGIVGNLVVAQQEQVQLKLDNTGWARITSGILEESGNANQYSYLVDMDLFREATVPYDGTEVSNHLRQLNRTAFALFTNIVSDEFLEDLGPVHEKDQATTEEVTS